jgi:hypothetical protein
MDERGLVGYEGLVTLIREPLLRPVQIVRQFISNHETQIRSISAYHRFEGLSSLPQNGGGSEEITNIPIGITNHISWLSRFGRYADIKV